MAMISETEAQAKGICMFCEHMVIGVEEDLAYYHKTSLCLSCREDAADKIQGYGSPEEDQQEFKLSSKSPIPIDVPGATNMGWLVLNHPKVFIGSHITCENYGLTVRFTIIPPTREAGERIVNTMRVDRENRNRKLRPGHKGNAPSRYTL